MAHADATATRAFVSGSIEVDSPNVTYTPDAITAQYTYDRTSVHIAPDGSGSARVVPETRTYDFRTARPVPKTGVMLVGLGGNNGSTLVGGLVANRLGLEWETRATGTQRANFWGSITQASTALLGECGDASGREVFAPLKALVPLLEPNDLVFGGWDINGADLAAAAERARVFEPTLLQQLRPHLAQIKPMPAPYYKDFIAPGQVERADNVLEGSSTTPAAKQSHLERIRKDIRDFKLKHELETVVVLWTANTERFSRIEPGLNTSADELLAAIERGEEEISPSTVFAVAAILEGCTFINGSPQNTFVPGCIELAERCEVAIAGDDFKTGQTKVKSVLADFLVTAGLKPVSIVSYNHLGNNDGRNLAAPAQFRSKEISKTNVVDDVVASNPLLYAPGEYPDHAIVIKYIPTVGDSKRAMDEYTSRMFMGGTNTLVLHNTCEDSLLAAPLMLDLIVLAELCGRIRWRRTDAGASEGDGDGGTKKSEKEWQPFHPVLGILGYLLKAPIAPRGAPVINALGRQRACLEGVLRACVGLKPASQMRLETLCSRPTVAVTAAALPGEKQAAAADKPCSPA